MEKLTISEPKPLPPLDDGVHVVLMRHGEPIKPTDNTQSSPKAKEDLAGLLTDSGRESTAQTMRQIVDKAKEQNPGKRLNFYFLGSPTKLIVDGVPRGARGLHTAEVASETIGNDNSVKTQEIGVKNVKPHRLLKEANYYFASGKPMPERYVGEVASRATLKGVDKQDIWLEQPEDLEEIRLEDELESPQDAAQRVSRLVEIINRHARLAVASDAEENYYVAVTHGDTLKAFLQTYFRDDVVASPVLKNPLVDSDGYNASVVLGYQPDGPAKLEASIIPEV